MSKQETIHLIVDLHVTREQHDRVVEILSPETRIQNLEELHEQLGLDPTRAQNHCNTTVLGWPCIPGSSS